MGGIKQPMQYLRRDGIRPEMAHIATFVNRSVNRFAFCIVKGLIHRYRRVGWYKKKPAKAGLFHRKASSVTRTGRR